MLEWIAEEGARFLVRNLLCVAVGYAVDFFQRWFGHQQAMPETIQAELSETDRRMISQTQNLLRQQFGDDISGAIKAMGNMERLQAANKFTQDLAALYGLDIEIDVMAQNIDNCGYYNRADRKVHFNIVELWIDNDDPQFDAHIQNFFDTIVHELRHAVQHKAVEEPGFWDVEEERRQAWDQNFAPGGYIQASTNIRGYMMQPVENDAFTFASNVMEGVFAQ